MRYLRIAILLLILIVGFSRKVLAVCDGPNCKVTTKNTYTCDNKVQDAEGVRHSGVCLQDSQTICVCGADITTFPKCGTGQYACNNDSGCCCIQGTPGCGGPTAAPVISGGVVVCTPLCQTACGNVNGTDGCGGTCACVECVSCVPRCGQEKSCGGNCPTTDVGTPVATTLVNPNGTVSSPAKEAVTQVPLSWNSVAYGSSYNVEVYDGSDTKGSLII